MEYRLIGGLKIPALIFGTATFGGGNEFLRKWGSTDVAEATRLIDVALDAGVTMFDTADSLFARAVGGNSGQGHRRQTRPADDRDQDRHVRSATGRTRSAPPARASSRHARRASNVSASTISTSINCMRSTR